MGLYTYKLNALDPQLALARSQPLHLSSDILVLKVRYQNPTCIATTWGEATAVVWAFGADEADVFTGFAMVGRGCVPL